MSYERYARVASPPQTMTALLTRSQWWSVLAISLAVGSFGLYFNHISQWIPFGFILAGAAAGHMIFSCRHCLPLPQTAILIYIVYYVFAPLANIYYPGKNPLFRFSDPGAYFEYAIPCLWATACGWSVAFYRARPIRIRDGVIATDPSLLRALDMLILCGMTIGLVTSLVKLPSSIATLGMLAANVRYIGVFCWALMARPGWKWRLLLVLAVTLYESASTGFFLHFLLWTVSACVVIMFRHRFSRTTIVLGLLFAAVFLPSFQHAKWELRRATWGVALSQQRLMVFGNRYELNSFSKVPLLIGKVAESAFTITTGRQNDEFIADTALRYNQGWIVGKVQQHVPVAEPYGNGETVYDAILASFFPRFLMPYKLTSGGGETFTRFSGVRLNSETSMNLGFIGEMYANYGFGFGIFACSIYGLFFGLIFQKLTAAAHANILILSFVPYILNFAVVSEVGLVDVLNYTIKSLIVAVGIYAVAPAIFSRITSYQAYRKSDFYSKTGSGY